MNHGKAWRGFTKFKGFTQFRGFTQIELIVAIAIGLVIIVAIMNFQKSSIMGYKKGSELSAETSALHLLLEHLKDDARSSLRLQTIASTSTSGVVEYRIGRAASSPDNPNEVVALESRYLFDQSKATIIRREYDCSTGTLLSEKDFMFKTDTINFELKKDDDQSPIDIGLLVIPGATSSTPSIRAY
jgi:type II secretory pathway pseudopilin PulG